jgi:hypothetical protein
MLGHRRSPANAAPDADSHSARRGRAGSDRASVLVARIIAANSSTGTPALLDPCSEGNTRMPQLLASSVLAVIGSADESWSARFGRLRQAPSLALRWWWRRMFTLDDADKLTVPTSARPSDEVTKVPPSLGNSAAATVAAGQASVPICASAAKRRELVGPAGACHPTMRATVDEVQARLDAPALADPETATPCRRCRGLKSHPLGHANN